MRATPEEYARLELRAHSLLADVPLHDVWTVELPASEHRRSMADLRRLMSSENLMASNPAVKFLFGLRAWLGRIFGWEAESQSESGGTPLESFEQRLTSADRESSLVAPGTSDGPFRVLFVSPREAISEIHNATVHAFSVFALVELSSGYRLYWAIYVRPVGRITGWYMRLIDPFRRFIIYPAALRYLQAAWARDTP